MTNQLYAYGEANNSDQSFVDVNRDGGATVKLPGVGLYRLSSVGRGAYGIVYADQSSGLLFKVLTAQNLREERQILEQGGEFSRELNFLQALYGDKVRVLGVRGEQTKARYNTVCTRAIQMPYIPGASITLDQYLKNNRSISCSALMGLFKRIIKTHQRDMSIIRRSELGRRAAELAGGDVKPVHGDLSPYNFVVTENGSAVVQIDWGNAGFSSEPRIAIPGVEHYYLWSKERAIAQGYKNPADDVYAVLVMVYKSILARLLSQVNDQDVYVSVKRFWWGFYGAKTQEGMFQVIDSMKSYLRENKVDSSGVIGIMKYLEAQMRSPEDQRVTMAGLYQFLVHAEAHLASIETSPAQFSRASGASFASMWHRFVEERRPSDVLRPAAPCA